MSVINPQSPASLILGAEIRRLRRILTKADIFDRDGLCALLERLKREILALEERTPCSGCEAMPRQYRLPPIED